MIQYIVYIQVPSVILTALPGPMIGGLALAGFGTSLALQVKNQALLSPSADLVPSLV